MTDETPDVEFGPWGLQGRTSYRGIIELIDRESLDFKVDSPAATHHKKQVLNRGWAKYIGKRYFIIRVIHKRGSFEVDEVDCDDELEKIIDRYKSETDTEISLDGLRQYLQDTISNIEFFNSYEEYNKVSEERTVRDFLNLIGAPDLLSPDDKKTND